MPFSHTNMREWGHRLKRDFHILEVAISSHLKKSIDLQRVAVRSQKDITTCE